MAMHRNASEASLAAESEEPKPSQETSTVDTNTATGSNDLERQPTGASTRNRSRDDPFGDEADAKVKYKTMAWWQAGMIMIAETISLGILSLPSVLATIGIVPGLILILGLGCLATYTGFVIGQFKLRHPWVHNMADAGDVLLGPIGREVFGAAQLIFLIFVMGSHILTFTIMLNTVSSHGACTIVFGVVGLVVCFLFTLPRQLGDVSYMSIASFISILAAVLVTMIAVGLEHQGPSQVQVTAQSTLYQAFLSVTNIIFAYAGHVAFFSFISELKNPEEYPKALFLLQGVDVTMYLIVAGITYRYAGPDVASPALGSASPLIQKISYGIAIPTIIIAGVVNGHVASKYIYVRLFRGTGIMQQKTFFSYGMWALIALILWTIAWIIAEAVPVFNNLLGLISALFASWFTYGLSGVFWLHMNWGNYTKTKTKMFLTALNTLIFIIGAVICGLGLYASGESIATTTGGSSFSCADNSGSSS